METKDLMTVSQAAERAGLSTHAIWKEIREGRLETVELGFQHQLLISPKAYATWLESRSSSGLTVGEVAELFGVPKSTVHTWRKRGQLRGTQVVGRIIFLVADVMRFAQERGLDVDEADLASRAA